MFRADLHTHTTCSDGSFTPEELIALAVEVGLSGLSITDHDTIEAYDTIVPVAEKAGIELIPGIEFSTRDKKESVHLLGYAFSLGDEEFRAFCQRHVVRRNERNEAMLARLRAQGFDLTHDELVELCGIEGKKIYGRPHIGQLMVNKGYAPNLKEAFNTWIGDGKRCFVEGTVITPEETIEAIHNAGGLAVIAHPCFIKYPKTLKRLMAMDFDGIEGYYSRLYAHIERRWIAKANEMGWISTGGSDFHGSAKPDIQLGCSWIDEPTFRRVQQGRVR